MAEAILTISSKNYSSWSLRGWLLCRMAGLDFTEQVVPVEDPANRAELLLLSPSILVPCLTHDGIRVWDTLAIAEYLNEVRPKAGLLPAAHHPNFKVWSGAQADIDRIAAIWRECFAEHRGPYLFGKLSMADAMYAPVVTRFLTYAVKLDGDCAGYCDRIMALPDMIAWREAALAEPDELEELDMEF
jgi:glutathione S-transferase